MNEMVHSLTHRRFIMSYKYVVYPVYGKDKPSCLCGVQQRTIIGIGKEYDDMKSVKEAIVSGKINKSITDNILIIDWKHYRYKKMFRSYNTVWHQFKMDEFYREFRFTSPCDDLELESKGYLVDAVSV